MITSNSSAVPGVACTVTNPKKSRTACVALASAVAAAAVAGAPVAADSTFGHRSIRLAISATATPIITIVPIVIT